MKQGAFRYHYYKQRFRRIRRTVARGLGLCALLLALIALLYTNNIPFSPFSSIPQAKAATQLYLRDSVPSINPGSDEERDLTFTRGSSVVSYAKDTGTGGTVTPPTPVTQFTKVSGGTNQIWYTPPLNGVTISGTVTFNLWAAEQTVAVNSTITAELLRADNSGAILLPPIASVVSGRPELTTSPAQNNWTVTPASTTLSLGDRLAVRVYIDDAGGSMASSKTVTMDIGGATAGADGDAYVQTTEAVSLQPITTIYAGTEPGNSSIAPGASATDLAAFALQTNTGIDTATAATVSLAAGSWTGLSAVSIVNNAGTTTYCSAADPASDTVSVSGCSIPVSTTSTQFKIRITPKSHATMPPPPGSTYNVTGTVTAFMSTNVHSGSDSGSATVTIDNESPTNATNVTVTGGKQQATVSWTNPGADFSQVVILRKEGSSISDAPVEGATYTTPGTIGASTIFYVGTVSPQTDTGLADGTTYYYKVFAKDMNSNYATGAEANDSTTNPPISEAFDNTFFIASNLVYQTAGQLTLTSGVLASGTLESNILDMRVANGAGINAVWWNGTKGTGVVGIQLAASNSSSGPWTYYNPVAAGGTCASTYAQVNPDIPTAINTTCSSNNFWNKRYFRYKLQLCYDSGACTATSGTSPVVWDVAVNWSK